MKKIAVVLAGCGVYDGSEIHEAVLTLLALEQHGASYQCLAPDMQQMHVINHLTGEEMAEHRNVLVESARIARGNIKNISDAVVDDYDGMVVPGGFGAAKNLSDFAVKGADMQLQKDFLRFAQAMHKAGKPIGLVCIAPTMAVKICGVGAQCTIGRDAEVAAAIEAMGGEHVECPVSDAIVDEANKLVTTPAYMLAGSIGEAARGINDCVKKLLVMA